MSPIDKKRLLEELDKTHAYLERMGVSDGIAAVRDAIVLIRELAPDVYVRAFVGLSEGNDALPLDVRRNTYTADREPGLHVEGLPKTES